MFIHSIRGRLLFWLAFLLVGILGGFGFTAYQLQSSHRFKQIDDDLGLRLAALNNEASDHSRPGPPGGRPDGPPPDEDDFGQPPPQGSPPGSSDHPGPSGEDPRHRIIRLSGQTQALFNQGDTNGFYFAFWSRDKDLLKRSLNAPADLPLPEHSRSGTTLLTRMRGDFREAFHFDDMGECALVGRNLATDFAAMRWFAFRLTIVGGAVLAFGLLGGGWLVSRSLRPVEKISAAALKISSGDLSQRISVAETDSELGKLAAILNSTFARLETSFAQQKQFTSDASHDLRTPITVLISEAQTTLARERSPEEYREAISACLDTAQKMRKLTESLLQLARMDAGQEFLHREKINLSALAQDCVKLIRPLAATRNLKIHCNFAPAETVCDATRIAQVVTNLLTNAINYNKDGGEIHVTTLAEKGAAILTVADTGQGIPAEDLPRVFERFYRAEKSRTGAGNSGLGLAISKAIVEAHGGSIEVSSAADQGTIFTVRLAK